MRLLRPGRSEADAGWPGDDEPDTAHFAVRTDAGAVVGVATLLRQPAPQAPTAPGWRLRGMATAPEVRGTGVGRAVLAAVCAHVGAQGGGLLWCNARMEAREFYRRAGFTAYGDSWEEPQIGSHIRMCRPITPALAERLGEVGEQVVGGLDADREPHQPGVDSQR